MAFKFSRVIKRPFNLFLISGVFSSSMSSSKENNSDSNLILYNHHHSYYSKKVVMTLEEKKIPYSTKLVMIEKNQQYEPWFLNINPNGEIPVLKDGDKVIIDSKRIIDYLEDNFSQSDFISLVPKDLNSEVRGTITELRTKIDSIEGNLLLFGLLYHREHVRSCDEHYPYSFFGVKGVLRSSVEKMPSELRKLAETRPDIKQILLDKAERAEKTRNIAQSKEKFDKELSALKILLTTMEEQLNTHPEGSDDWWLCCDRFTQADVSLAVLLERLYLAGALDYFLMETPRLRIYFKRLEERDSFKRIRGTFWDDKYLIWPF